MLESRIRSLVLYLNRICPPGFTLSQLSDAELNEISDLDKLAGKHIQNGDTAQAELALRRYQYYWIHTFNHYRSNHDRLSER